DQPALLDVEMAEGLEVFGQGANRVAGPGVEGGREVGLIDQPDLQRQQAAEEGAGGVGGHRCVSGQRRGAGTYSISPRRRGSVQFSRRISRIIAYSIWPFSLPLGQFRSHNRSPLPPPRPWRPVCLSTPKGHC